MQKAHVESYWRLEDFSLRMQLVWLALTIRIERPPPETIRNWTVELSMIYFCDLEQVFYSTGTHTGIRTGIHAYNGLDGPTRTTHQRDWRAGYNQPRKYIMFFERVRSAPSTYF